METTRKTTTILLAFVLLIISISLTSAKDIYVTPKITETTNNSENGCGLSMSSPCENINEALKWAEPGDKILLEAGIFTGVLNAGLLIKVPSIQIKGVAGATIIDLQFQNYAFLVTQPGVHFIDIIFRNGFSSENSFSGAITLRLNPTLQTSAVPSLESLSLSNVFFTNIIGGALLVDSFSSQKIFQVRLVKVVFENISKKPALSLLGNVHAQISTCKFQNNGHLPSISSDLIASSYSSSQSEIVGAAIFATGNTFAEKTTTPTITLSECIFTQNEGISIIDIEGVDPTTTMAADLFLAGKNTFNKNIASKNIIQTHPRLSLIICLNCQPIWTSNQAPKLCDVSCSLLGIHEICPGSCPPHPFNLEIDV